MNLIVWTLVGLVTGLTARMLIPGKSAGGSTLTVTLGIAGAFGGGYLGIVAGIGGGAFSFDVGTSLFAVAGSLLLLLLYRSFAGSELRT